MQKEPNHIPPTKSGGREDLPTFSASALLV